MSDFPTIRHKGYYSHIIWIPYGMECEASSGRLAIGVIVSGTTGWGFGLIDLSRLDAVAAVLPNCSELGEIGALLIDSIRQERLSPEQAHEKWPGMQPSCYQNWAVTRPRPFVQPQSISGGMLEALMRRQSGFPLHVTEIHEQGGEG